MKNPPARMTPVVAGQAVHRGRATGAGGAYYNDHDPAGWMLDLHSVKPKA